MKNIVYLLGMIPVLKPNRTIKSRITELVVGTMITVLSFNSGSIFYNGVGFIKDTFDKPEITAHRGGAEYTPENTMSALEYAVKQHADYAEIDVRETKDGVLVLLHDENLIRTTGVKKDVSKITYEKLQTLDVGSWFSSKYVGESIPTLQEAMEYCKGKIDLNIEIKRQSKDDEFVEKVVTLIEENKFRKHCVVSSMNYNYLKEVKELNPKIKTCFIVTSVVHNIKDLKYADYLSIKYTYVSTELINVAHKEGKKVYVWTVNTEMSLNLLKGFDVDNIITDNPNMARRVMEKKTAKEFFLSLFQPIDNE